MMQVPVEIEHQYENVASQTGESKDDLVREALLSYLEDRHFSASAEERLKNIGERTSLADLGKEFGLAD